MFFPSHALIDIPHFLKDRIHCGWVKWQLTKTTSYFLQRWKVPCEDEVKLPSIYSFFWLVKRLPSINVGGFWVIISNNSIEGELLDGYWGLMAARSENSTLPDLEQVGKIRLRASSSNKLVPRALCLWFDHGTVMQIQSDIFIEGLAGLDPVDGWHQLALLWQFKLSSQDRFHRQTDGSASWDSSCRYCEPEAMVWPTQGLVSISSHLKHRLSKYFSSQQGI